MPQYPKNVENLFNEYINDIREWFKYNNKFGLDGHEFESSFYTKVIEKDTLSFFLQLRNNYDDEEIYNLFGTYDISKLDINRIYRYLDKYTKINTDVEEI